MRHPEQIIALISQNGNAYEEGLSDGWNRSRRIVGRELGVEPSQLCLVACHTWDTLGAVAAGWRAALIKRVGNDLLGVGPQPQIVGSDLNDVANQLIARHKRAA
jgi:hypothetical protein